MITQYLTDYGYDAALLIFFIAGISLFAARYIIPGVIVFLSASAMITLRVMHKISFNEQMISYVKNEDGQVISANFEMTLWQSTSLWVDPICFIFISLSILLLSNQRIHKNKQNMSLPG